MQRPFILDENAINIPRNRPPRSKDAHRPARSTPRKISRKLRPTASVPVLRSPSAKRVLRQRGSRLDLLDNCNLTSFPDPTRKSNDMENLRIIEDYIPVRPQHEQGWPLPPVVQSVPDQQHPETWQQTIWRKLRWRWRLQGLIH